MFWAIISNLSILREFLQFKKIYSKSNIDQNSIIKKKHNFNINLKPNPSSY